MTKKTWKVALFFGLPWTIIMITIKSIIAGGITGGIVISNIFAGVVAGILFALIMQYSANQLYKKTTIELESDELSVKEGGANHFRGKEAVGGKLVLTDKRLIFKSHKLNIQNHLQFFAFEEIGQVSIVETLKIFKNGLLLELTNGSKHKFVVDEPAEWVAAIEKQKSLYS